MTVAFMILLVVLLATIIRGLQYQHRFNQACRHIDELRRSYLSAASEIPEQGRKNRQGTRLDRSGVAI